MLLLRLSVVLAVVWATTGKRVHDKRQFNAGFDASYASAGGGSGTMQATFKDCNGDIGDIENGSIRCVFSGCRVRCDRGYATSGGAYLMCDLGTGLLMYNEVPWREQEPICSPVCRGGCDHGQCVAPGQCQCHDGFTGATCADTQARSDVPVSPLGPSAPTCDPPCQNGGSCTAHNYCSCVGTFWGPQCQMQRCQSLQGLKVDNADLEGNPSRVVLRCRANHATKSGLESLSLVCRRGRWVVFRRGFLADIDVNCYPKAERMSAGVKGGVKG